MQLAKDGKILLDIDEAIESNHATVMFHFTPTEQSLSCYVIYIEYETLKSDNGTYGAKQKINLHKVHIQTENLTSLEGLPPHFSMHKLM